MAPDAEEIRASTGAFAPEPECQDCANDIGYSALDRLNVGRFAMMFGDHLIQQRGPKISEVIDRYVRRGESLDAAHSLSVGAHSLRYTHQEVYPFLQSPPMRAIDMIEAVFSLARSPGPWGALGDGLVHAKIQPPAQPPAEKREFDAESRRMMNRVLVGKGGRKRGNPMGRKR